VAARMSPVAAASAGAACISSSAVLMKLAGASPSLTALGRCALALPVLGALALAERRRGASPLPSRSRWLARLHDFRLGPAWPALGWLALLALTSQVIGWMLITVSMPRLPASMIGALLLIQPAGSVALSYIFLGERPSALQLAGVVLVLAGVFVAVSGNRPRPAERVTVPELPEDLKGFEGPGARRARERAGLVAAKDEDEAPGVGGFGWGVGVEGAVGSDDGEAAGQADGGG
jgi:drug/metabolite transporter (DMT)-like permease